MRCACVNHQHERGACAAARVQAARAALFQGMYDHRPTWRRSRRPGPRVRLLNPQVDDHDDPVTRRFAQLEID
jgi:hypothetical protein